MCVNIGISHQGPSVYLPTGTDSDLIKDVFLSLGDSCVYPVPDTGVRYSGAVDKRWSFTYQGEGNDVDTSVAIDRVAVTFYAWLPFGKKIRPYFRTGGNKYYSGEQEGEPNTFESSNLFGNSSPTGGDRQGYAFPGGPFLWSINPATNAPWELSDITGGEFGFETDAATQHGALDYIFLTGAYVEIYWGWETMPAGGPGGDPLPAPCGQSATFRGGWTNFTSEILEVEPAFGPLTGGTRVTIRGTNFVTGSSVFIGGLPATDIVFVDEEHYLVTTPAHSVGWTDVVIIEPAGIEVTKRNGFQYTLFTRGEDIRRLPAVNIRLGLSTGQNGASFSVDGDSNPPKVGEQIQLIDEEQSPRRLLFAGNVQRVKQDYEGQTNQLVWACEAVDYTWLLNRRRPFGTYENVSASDIVRDLINRYAPGFTTNFVQTNLAKITVFFDGSSDLVTCLTIVARMIGGGHWYVDFTEDVHFFHVIPPNVSIPALPPQPAPSGGGTGAAGTGATGSPTTFLTMTESSTLFLNGAVGGKGFFSFQVSFVFDNGVETALGPLSNPVGTDGVHQYTLSSIPIGAAVSIHNVVKRRIYARFNGPGGFAAYPLCQINDNSTTSITVRGANLFSPVTVGVVPAGTTYPPQPFRAYPLYSSATAPTPTQLSTKCTNGQPEYAATNAVVGEFTYSKTSYRFRVSNIYRDGRESVMGPVSAFVSATGTNAIRLTNVPVGAADNGVVVIARRIWASAVGGVVQDKDFFSWWLLPDNTTTTVNVWPATGAAQVLPPATGVGETPDRPPSENPVWPNDDGPFLEDYDRPDDVTDDNPDLLRDPQVTSTVDQSQLRNRVLVRGAGADTSAFVSRGATAIPVTDCWFYATQGGLIFCEGSVMTYVGKSAESGPGSLLLSAPAPEDFNMNAPVSLYLVVEDKDAQVAVGSIEVDHNGLPTDGVHEFQVTDASLITLDQMYMRGYAELELFAKPVTTVVFASRSPKFRPGAKVNINLTNPPIVGENFLVTSVVIDQFHDEADDTLTPRYTVTCSSVKFNLDDLFFLWATSINRPPAPPTNPPSPGGGGPTGPTDPRIPPTGPGPGDPPTSAYTRPIYISADVLSTTAKTWSNSNNLFALISDTMYPPVAQATRNDTPAFDPAVSHRAYSGPSLNDWGLIWVGPYTRGNPMPLHFLDRFLTTGSGGDTSGAWRTVPLDPNNGQSYSGSTGCIRDWSPNVDYSKVYFVSQDFVKGSFTAFSRIMEVDFDTWSITQIGQCTADNGLPIIPTPLGDGNLVFFSVLCLPSNELYAGAGAPLPGFNSTGAGVYKLIGSTWTRVLDLEATQPLGQVPVSLEFLEGHIYVGTESLGSVTGKIYMTYDGGASWILEFETASTGSNSSITRLKAFNGRMYACTYNNDGVADVTRIYRRDTAVGQGTWDLVAQIESQATPQKGVEMFTVGPGNGGADDTLVVVCVHAGGNGKVMSSRNGSDWSSSALIQSITSTAGVLRLP